MIARNTNTTPRHATLMLQHKNSNVEQSMIVERDLFFVRKAHRKLKDVNTRYHEAVEDAALTPNEGKTKRLSGLVLEMWLSAFRSDESSLMSFMFSSIRDGVTDLGMTALPRATTGRISTNALQRVDYLSYDDSLEAQCQGSRHASLLFPQSPFLGTKDCRCCRTDCRQ